MSKVAVYNLSGDKVSEIELKPEIFNVAVKPEVVQSVVVIQKANSREAIAHAKDRSEVSGGGRKPWRQKGTGRARHGSSRSPIWRSGGATFGPTADRNFSQKINKKVKRKALLMTLSDKAQNEKIIVVENLNLEVPKTKQFFEMLQNLKLRSKTVKAKTEKSQAETKKPKRESSVLLVLEAKNDNVIRASRNVSRVNAIAADSLNVIDVLKHQYLLLPLESLKVIEKTFVK